MFGQDVPLESQVRNLTESLEELRARVAALEGRGGAMPLTPRGDEPLAREPVASPEPAGPLADLPLGRLSSLAGRAVLVLAGGFLLRAISDAGFAPKLAVAIVGMLYAALWMLMALRRKGESARAASFFDVGAGALVAFPLVSEITVRFALVSAPAAAALTVGFSALVFFVGRRLGHREIEWIGTGFGAATMLVVAFGVHAFVPTLLATLAALLALEVLAFTGSPVRVRWIAAGTLDLLAAVFLMVLSGDGTLPESYPPFDERVLLAALIAMPAVSMSGAAARSLIRGREVDLLDCVQVPLAALLGLGGAFALSPGGGTMATVIASLLLVLGLAGYGLTFSYADRRRGHTRNFYFYSTIGGLMILFGSSLLLEAPLLALTWAALAVVASLLGVRFERFTLRLHGAIYLVAAFAGGGLYAASLGRIVTGPPSAWAALGGLPVVALVLTILASTVLSRRPRQGSVNAWRLGPELIAMAHASLATAGLAVGLMSAGFGHEPGLVGPALLSVMRTATLSCIAVALAYLASRARLREAGWLVWPLLVACGSRLLADDLRRGTALSICISLAFFGTALILASRQQRTEAPEERTPSRSRPL